ncbi:MAG: Release factor glutamine methyltransferase [candidate division BRC1 bacterium ADurb.BinA364]|nr:MAG: Release factor glutamine methyltransferase [candidate division BRC1 bacterium ADurb.BinA364]
MSQETLTIREILRRTVPFLENKGCQCPRLDAEVLLADALSTERIGLYLDMDRPLGDAEIEAFRERVRRRARLEPVAYIVGVREFFSMPFAVDPRVLIPRPETEFVVEAAQEALEGVESPRIIDIGTGSGAIAIALARHLGGAPRILATDISAGALEVARQNALTLGAAQSIEFIQGDLFAGAAGPFDLIVSNPPYVPEADRPSLRPDVANYEPPAALFAGHDGLDAIRRLIQQSPAHLKNGGWLIFEIGYGQAPAVEALIEALPALAFEGVRADLAGIPRAVRARKIAD